MALINISVDTELKTLSASINGKEIADACRVYIYQYSDYYDKEKHISVNIDTETKEDDVRKVTSYYASKTEEDSEPKEGSTLLNDFSSFLGR